VTVVELEHRKVERVVEIEGTLKAWEELTVSAKQGGHVQRVAHDMGDRVAPGEVLLELDPVDGALALKQAEAKYIGELAKLGVTRKQAEEFVKRYGANESLLHNVDTEQLIKDLPAYKQAFATREKARQELTRQQGLYARGAGVMQDLQNAQNDVQATQAALDNVELTARTNLAAAIGSRVALDVAQQQLSELVVTVPKPVSLPSGHTRLEDVAYAVSKRLVSEGQRLKDGDPVFELVIEDPIRLWTNVPERFRGDVEVGQPVRVTAMSRPGETFEGRVARINPAVDPVSRTFQVESLIPNGDGKLRPGGFGRGKIVVKSDAQAVVVPVESVYRFAGVTKIFLVEDGRSKGYSVELGQELVGGVEVVGAEVTLPEAGKVVATGQSMLARLAEGTRVVVREPELTPVNTRGHEGEAEKKPGSAEELPASDVLKQENNE
jgi:multidrug efflux pump subunit AcrA (membrane-fusion protein)